MNNIRKYTIASLILSALTAVTLCITFILYRSIIITYLSNSYVDLYSAYTKIIQPFNIIVMILLVVSILLMSVLTMYLLIHLRKHTTQSYLSFVLVHLLNSTLDALLTIFLLTNFTNVFTGSIDSTTLVFVIVLTLITNVIVNLFDAGVLLEHIDLEEFSLLPYSHYYFLTGISALLVGILGFVLTGVSTLALYYTIIYVMIVFITVILVTAVIQLVIIVTTKDSTHSFYFLSVCVFISLIKLIQQPLYYSVILFCGYGIVNIIFGILEQRKHKEHQGMKISEIVEATGGKLLCGDLNAVVDHFTQDSRQCKDNSMYIPIIGENNDGHHFIQSAFDYGASTIITEKEITDDTHNIILVKDTTIALGDMARYIRVHHNVKVVGITGSVGKTSTKDMIYSVVSQKYKSLKTLGNYNNQIGLPLTILRYQDEEVMVIEMGMNHLREIAYLSSIAQPDIAAITNVGTAHIGEVGGRDNILKAKMEITEGLKENGILVLNDDNDKLHEVKADQFHVIRVGNNADTFKPLNVQLDLLSSDFDLNYQNKTYHVHVPVPGAHFITNALIAIAIGTSLDIEMEDCIKGIETFELTKNRMDLIQLDQYITLIDGTYNANVDSMKSSIDVLASSKNRKIAVLGDMLELGEYEEDLHKEVGEYLSNKVDVLLCVGNASKYILEASNNIEVKKHFDDNQSLIDYLKNAVRENDVILVKGSNGMHLKEVVEAMKDQESKS